MAKPRKILSLLKSASGPALALLVIAFFGGYAIIGANGVLAWGDYNKLLKKRQAELATLEKEREALEHRVALLDPKKANPDMVDELVRKELGVVHPDEIVIPLQD